MSPIGSTGPESNQIMAVKASSFVPKHQMLQNAFDIFYVKVAKWHIWKKKLFKKTLCVKWYLIFDNTEPFLYERYKEYILQYKSFGKKELCAKVGWLIQFFDPLGKEEWKKNMTRPGFEPSINQSIANSLNQWAMKLLEMLLLLT